jgi:hypothetical protein
MVKPDALVEIKISQRPGGGLILGLREGFFEFTIEEFRLDLLVVGTLSENGFPPFGFVAEHGSSVVEVRPFRFFGRRLMEYHLAQLGVHRERRSTAGAQYFEFLGTTRSMRHFQLMLSLRNGGVNAGAGFSCLTLAPR